MENYVSRMFLFNKSRFRRRCHLSQCWKLRLVASAYTSFELPLISSYSPRKTKYNAATNWNVCKHQWKYLWQKQRLHSFNELESQYMVWAPLFFTTTWTVLEKLSCHFFRPSSGTVLRASRRTSQSSYFTPAAAFYSFLKPTCCGPGCNLLPQIFCLKSLTARYTSAFSPRFSFLKNRHLSMEPISDEASLNSRRIGRSDASLRSCVGSLPFFFRMPLWDTVLRIILRLPHLLTSSKSLRTHCISLGITFLLKKILHNSYQTVIWGIFDRLDWRNGDKWRAL